MSRTVLVVVLATLALSAVGVYGYYFAPPRLTQAQLDASKEALRKIETAKAQTSEAAAVPPAPAQPAPVPENTTEEAPMEWPDQAPDTFKIKFECSNGTFVMQCHKEWAPIGVEHFYKLVKLGFYDGARFFRVVPGFVVQFGLPADPALGAKYGEENLKDEPVKKTNAPGTVTYAKTGAPNSRSTQLFINLGNNARLDGMGFAPFAEITEGMDVVKAITSQYGESPDQMMIRVQGNAYLESAFPKLDYIRKATLTK